MSDQASAAPSVLLTHWDPDLYPSDPLPLIHELVLHILTHGEVVLKDIDLFLTPKIRDALSDEGTLVQFASLLQTGRVKVLLPPLESTTFEIDPKDHPISAVALERHERRPFKGHPWRMTPSIKRFCAALDRVIVPAGVVRFRAPFPKENTFAQTLAAVLQSHEKKWRRRPEFRAITGEMADTFTRFCAAPSEAVASLERRGIVPLRTDFYKVLTYQCADLYPSHQRRAMKNLIQSVYTHCELERENAVGTYYGTRLAELPPAGDSVDNDDLVGLRVLTQPSAVEIPVAANIGEIVANVMKDCGPRMRHFWELDDSKTAAGAFIEMWAEVSEAFARHSVKAEPVRWTRTAKKRWELFQRVKEVVHPAIITTELAGLGIKLLGEFMYQPHVLETALGVQTVMLSGKKIVEWIRRGKAYDDRDTERDRVRLILLDSAAIRCGRV